MAERRISAADSTAAALSLIELLAGTIGPRRPCSDAELAARSRCARSSRRGHRRTGSSASPPIRPSAPLRPALLSRPGRRRAAPPPPCPPIDPALRATAGALAEGSFARLSPSALLARSPQPEPGRRDRRPGEAQRTLCLLSHLDTSRSGLMFHPSVTPHLTALVGLSGAASAPGPRAAARAPPAPAVSCCPCPRRHRRPRPFVAERELRGDDVPGANDNASGAAACAVLAAECAAKPLEHRPAWSC